MPGTDRDDFYVGYLAKAPTGLARFLRFQVVFLVVIAAVMAGLLAARQTPFDPGTFEYGTVRSFEGVVHERPLPRLEIDDPAGRPASILLVAFGKHGAAKEVVGLGGSRVRLEGTLVYREGETMIEIASGSLQRLDVPATSGGSPPTVVEDLGIQELVGEIVDSKCYLGVMKPGRGKPHRACAALCLRGGIPPIFVVETEGGERRHLLLLGPGGAAMEAPSLDLVALPVRVRGRVERRADELRMVVASIERASVGK